MRRACVALALGLALLLPEVAHAQRGAAPTAGPFSLFGARTLRVREKGLAAGIGWPSAFFEYDIGISTRLDVGFRGDLYYGSPFFDFDTALGGGFYIPIRIHLFGRGHIDLAIGLRPGITMGEGRLFGQQGAFADNFGFALHLGDPSFIFSITAAESLNVFARAELQVVVAFVPDADEREVFASLGFVGGLEINLARDLNLFIETGVGPGFAPRHRYDHRIFFRFWFGIEYLI